MRIALGCVVLVIVTGIFYHGASPEQRFDVVIRQGNIYDGSGNKPFIADIGINADTIAAIGDLSGAVAKRKSMQRD